MSRPADTDDPFLGDRANSHFEAQAPKKAWKLECGFVVRLPLLSFMPVVCTGLPFATLKRAIAAVTRFSLQSH
jgi:hypothetical protein